MSLKPKTPKTAADKRGEAAFIILVAVPAAIGSVTAGTTTALKYAGIGFIAFMVWAVVDEVVCRIRAHRREVAAQEKAKADAEAEAAEAYRRRNDR